MGDHPVNGLERVKAPFQSARGQFFERYTSPHTHPGGSIWRTTIQKLRVLGTFIARRMALGPGRDEALSKLRELTGSLTGKEVLVIGSGPSSQKLNLREVKKRQSAGDLTVIATNYFLHSPLARTITPDYLVWADSAFDPSNSAKSSHEWKTVAAREGVTVVVPWTWRSVVDTTPMASRAIYFDNDSLEGWSGTISPLKPRGYQGSTGVKALAIALHLEPSSVLLVGLDLSYYRNFVVDQDNRVLRQPTHIAGADSGTQEIGQHSVNGLADALYSTANQFLALHTHFAGRSVINLDPDSLVDAFPKVVKHPLMKKQPRKKP